MLLLEGRDGGLGGLLVDGVVLPLGCPPHQEERLLKGIVVDEGGELFDDGADEVGVGGQSVSHGGGKESLGIGLGVKGIHNGGTGAGVSESAPAAGH
jgi:hypothetical protein